MCGILGKFALRQIPDLQNRISESIEQLKHRGPDDQGFETVAVAGGTLVLGHTRLSIIDLSKAGHQPMHFSDGKFTLVFNGEIYNYLELREELKTLGYVFHTQTDTEVLLTAWVHWKEECLSKLTGMFAFAIWDHADQSVTLARDPFGIKPLFYSIDGREFAFASELKGLLPLLDDHPKLNYQRVFDYLRWGSYSDLPETLYENVVHLLPGYFVKLSLGGSKLPTPVRWFWPSVEERTDLSFNQAAEQFRELFLQSIRLHLRSDVPLGACLSGGLDSSAIVCAMRHIEPDMPIHTFTYVARGTAVDEEKWADIVNRHVSANAHKVVVAQDDLAVDIDNLIRRQGEPFMSTSIYAQQRVFKAAKESGIVVTLDGQGADETLAGYAGYPHARIRSHAEKWHYVKAMRFARAYSQKQGVGRSVALQTAMFGVAPKKCVSWLKQMQNKQALPSWFNSQAVKSLGLRLRMPDYADDVPRGRRLVGALRHSLLRQGLPALLRHGDRSSMHYSIESRVPFLEVNLVKFLLTLPEGYLVSQDVLTKRILRAGLRGIVPDIILDRKDKIGFRTPEKGWLKSTKWSGGFGLNSLDQIPILNAPEVRQKISSFLTGNHSRDTESWRLINFMGWYEQNTPTIR